MDQCRGRQGNGDSVYHGHLSGKGSSVEAGVPLNSVKPALVDPLFKDLSPRHRLYINHFSTLVCQDLVSFDQQDHSNPFRSVIALLGSFDYLREIILATSAVHMVTLRRSHGQPHHQQELIDALTARGRAYRLLREALGGHNTTTTPTTAHIVFIAVVFFINFDLIDSGRGNWKTHLQAAGRLITSIQGSTAASTTSRTAPTPPRAIAQLADTVMADCITYHILGSVLTAPPPPPPPPPPEEDGDEDGSAAAAEGPLSAFTGIDIPAALQRAAAVSYGCFPPPMLDVLSRAGRLAAFVNGHASSADAVVGEAAALMGQLRGVDVRAWVYGIEGLSPRDDLEVRVSMACAHRAAICLYVVLAVPDVVVVRYRSDHRLGGRDDDGYGPAECRLAREVLYHLACVPVDHALAKGLIWPTFMAGAQVEDLASRQWCLGRMQRIWRSSPWSCPWGYVEAAMDMMQRVWEARDRKLEEGDRDGMNWLQEMRATADHVLIV
ncbi:hypothetical protein VPNG_08972 [Cytospora leucostoma]|uniref:Acriflavine sensitivity control protein acr-2 n=1 Tax=Cytospora leucostoma TaxID=1230097 RepID=A0A423VW47_9PEZI|nr:hypothetical protein VPNG_08972 [Cytospora leucostoma]